MSRKTVVCICPICGSEAHQVQVFPELPYDPPYELFIDCPECGAYEPQQLEEEDEDEE